MGILSKNFHRAKYRLLNSTANPSMTQLRKHLMSTLADLRDRDNPMEPDRARAIGQVAGVLVDTARVEVEFIKATGSDGSGFIPGREGSAERPQITQGAHNPFLLAAGRKK